MSKPLHELIYDEHCTGWRDWVDVVPERQTDYALTFALHRRSFPIWWRDSERWHLEYWVIVEVARNGDLLAYRECDEPTYDKPGVAYYRWFPGAVLASALQSRWGSDTGWDSLV